MWPLDNPDLTDPPGQPASADPDDSDDLAERRVRHRSENIEIFIVRKVSGIMYKYSCNKKNLPNLATKHK